MAAADAAADAFKVAGQPRQAKPQHVNRGGGDDALQAGQAADLREGPSAPTVSAACSSCQPSGAR
jgi:hypothetical protein